MTEVRIEQYLIPAADLGPENPLPQFQAPRRGRRGKIDQSVPEEDRRYIGWRTSRRILPYRMQDGYNRDKRPRAFRAAVIENEFLKATVLPELGGRLVSLIHKPTGRELLERNPVFQPANLALRNAWFSGGIEWNAGQPGHHYFTCSPVFAARIDGADGPSLRIYEWERSKRFPWQVDLILPPGSPFLFARVRLVNPHSRMIPMYWWTNISVPEQPGTRVIAPAAGAIHGMPEIGLAISEPTKIDGHDASYPTNAPHAREHFFRVPRDERKWITSLDSDGAGLFHASTPRLIGRKLFVWGMNPGGRWWQRHLAEEGSAYVEIQAGLARTQLECIPMPGKEHWTWTEAFGLLQADPKLVHSPDWTTAWQAAGSAIDAILPQSRLDALDECFAEVTSRPPQEMLAVGSGWGALERLRVARTGGQDRVPPELVFDESTLGPDQQPWIDLLEKGYLPERDPSSEPGQFMVQPEWRKLLEASLQTERGDNWLAWYHLGNMRLESRDPKGAREAWETSVERRRNGWALRNLSIVVRRAGERQRGRELMREAWEAGPKVAALAIERAEMLMRRKHYDELLGFVDELPEDVREHERIQIMAAHAAISVGRLEGIERFFDREFSKIREGEVTLTELWFAYQAKRVSMEENVPITRELYHRVYREFPPPKHIDFRMR